MRINDLGDRLVVYTKDNVDLSDISRIILNIKNKNYEIKDIDKIIIYHDKNVGTILEIFKTESDYLGYIDIDVSVSKIENILFKLEETYHFNIDVDIYKYKGEYYLKIKESNPLLIARILEYSSIIYGDLVKKVMKHGVKVIKGGIII